MRILGIDPGSSATGFGVVERRGGDVVHVAHGVIRMRAGGLSQRLDELHRAVRAVLEQHRPDAAAVEQVFVAASPRSALVLGQARGAVLAAVGGAGLPVSEYSAAQIKQAVTGDGRAPKRQVQTMVRRLLGLERLPAADAADGLAAAVCHAQSFKLAALGAVGASRRRGRRGPALRVRRAP